MCDPNLCTIQRNNRIIIHLNMYNMLKYFTKKQTTHHYVNPTTIQMKVIRLHFYVIHITVVKTYIYTHVYEYVTSVYSIPLVLIHDEACVKWFHSSVCVLYVCSSSRKGKQGIVICISSNKYMCMIIDDLDYYSLLIMI